MKSDLFNKKDIEFILLLSFLGGRYNITKINNCATRLRLEVKYIDKVEIEEIKKYYPAVEKINNNEVHIVVGTNANLMADDLNKLLENQSLKILSLIPLIGGINNIIKINNCATRLRLEVKYIDKVEIEEIKKYYPAVEKINNNEVHIVVGTDSNLLANELKKFTI